MIRHQQQYRVLEKKDLHVWDLRTNRGHWEYSVFLDPKDPEAPAKLLRHATRAHQQLAEQAYAAADLARGN